mgnify:CR=1 FL=1
MTLKVHVVNTASVVEVPAGSSLLELAEQLSPALGFKPYCANVNNETVNLRYPLYTPKTVEFMPLDSKVGVYTYIRSLSMLLYKAVHDLYPGTRLRIEHATTKGIFCRLFKGQEVNDDVVKALEQRMHELIAADLPYKRHEKLTTEVIEIFRKQGQMDKVRLLETGDRLYKAYYSLEGLCDSYYGCLAPSTGYIQPPTLKPYKNGFIMNPFNKAEDLKLSKEEDFVQEQLYNAFTDYQRINQIIGVRNAGELNLAAEKGYSAEIINVAEALHAKFTTRIADEIASRHKEGRARIVLVAGPSSSGKTTFTKRLAVQLFANEIRPQMISLDDYFVNRVDTPLDEKGDYDYESLYALDLKRFNADLTALIEGKTVELPYYNFAKGEREFHGKTVTLSDNTVLLIEGIHALNPELTASIPRELKYLVYASALTTIAIDDHNWISTWDNRLLRRIIRDNQYRGVSPAETIRRWPSVVRGEQKWIYPYHGQADAMFNSSLLYELAVIKPLAERLLHKVPRNVPEYVVASRLLTFLSYFRAIEPDALPFTSLLREFVGGSTFKY